MEGGKVGEYNSPKSLLLREDSLFSQLVKADVQESYKVSKNDDVTV